MTGITERPVRLENELGLPVRCDVRVPEGEGPFPTVVILHGFKGFKDWGMFPPTARRLAEAGLATVTMNASRNGVGEGLLEFTELEEFARNTPGREAADVGRVLDAIDSGELGPGLDANRIGLLGHSRGGGVVTLVASRDPRVRCVVTWASIASFHRYTRRAIEGWRERGRLEVPNMRTGQVLWLDVEVLDDLEAHRDEYDLAAAAGRIRVPFLAVHGEQDEAVDAGDSEKLVARVAAEEKRVRVIPRTGHTFGAVHPWKGPTPAWEEAVAETVAWFGRLVSRPVRDPAKPS